MDRVTLIARIGVVLILLSSLLALCLARATEPIAPPPCYWGEAPCTRAYSTAYEEPEACADGVCYGGRGLCWQWYHPMGDVWQEIGFCGLLRDIVPADIADLPHMTKEQRDARWATDITRPFSATELATWDSLLSRRPASVYVVAGYSPAMVPPRLTRPTYHVVAGVRGGINGRVKISASCQCSVLQLEKYCSVGGHVNELEPGKMLPPWTVALCAVRKVEQ